MRGREGEVTINDGVSMEEGAHLREKGSVPQLGETPLIRTRCHTHQTQIGCWL